jgi:hypothetical protein
MAMDIGGKYQSLLLNLQANTHDAHSVGQVRANADAGRRRREADIVVVSVARYRPETLLAIKH